MFYDTFNIVDVLNLMLKNIRYGIYNKNIMKTLGA